MEQTCKQKGSRFSALLRREKNAGHKKRQGMPFSIYCDPAIIFDNLGEDAAIEYIYNCAMAVETMRAYNGELL